MDKQIVVARHGEDLAWTSGLRNVLVYDKHPSARLSTFENLVCRVAERPFNWLLPNVGREAHTYLYHVVSWYDGLADVTVFLQGSPLEHFTMEELNRLINHDTRAMAGLNMVDIAEWDESGQLNEMWRYDQWARKMRAGQVRRAPLSFAAWHEKYVGPLGQKVRYYMGAMFAVHKQAIHRRRRSYYQELLRQVSDHPDPEESYYLERAWPAVFMAQAECVNLNNDSLAIGNHRGLGRVEVA